MQSLRQLGIGVILAIVSILLVIGGVMLSLAESLPPASTPTQIPPTLPHEFPTPTATVTASTPSETPTETQTATVSVSQTETQLAATATPCVPPAGWIRITTAAGDTIYSVAQRYKTSAENLSVANCLLSAELPAGSTLYVPPVPTVTVVPCGPPIGWVRAHVVRAGDTLSRIAIAYNTTVTQLQRANCMGSSTIIYIGQRLWVPNVPTRTPIVGTTIIPDLPTSTDTPTPIPATEVPTFTPSPTTPPTFTDAPTFTSTATLTQ